MTNEETLRATLKEVRDFLWAVGVTRQKTFTDDQVKCFNETLAKADAALAETST